MINECVLIAEKSAKGQINKRLKIQPVNPNYFNSTLCRVYLPLTQKSMLLSLRCFLNAYYHVFNIRFHRSYFMTDSAQVTYEKGYDLSITDVQNRRLH